MLKCDTTPIEMPIYPPDIMDKIEVISCEKVRKPQTTSVVMRRC